MLRTSTRLVFVPDRPLKRAALNAQAVVDSLDFELFSRVSAEKLAEAKLGIDMYRLDFSGRLPAKHSLDDTCSTFLSSAFGWLKSVGFPSSGPP